MRKIRGANLKTGNAKHIDDSPSNRTYGNNNYL